MTPPAAPLVAPELFDILTKYASEIAQGKVKATFGRGVTAPALTFCENFYVQFFQNRLKRPIQRINPAAKETAVRLRKELKAKKEDGVIILLITSFEKLCDTHSTILGMTYGTAGEDFFLDFSKILHLLSCLRETLDSIRTLPATLLGCSRRGHRCLPPHS
jgi:hypothetical protein